MATAKDRLEFLRRLGMRIHREPIYRDARITVTGLGAQMEVGRSAILIRTKESSILLDCGVKPSSSGDEAPLLDELDLDTLDAVVITHAHMDHIGYVHTYSSMAIRPGLHDGADQVPNGGATH